MSIPLTGHLIRIANSAFPTREITSLREENFPLVDVDYFCRLNGKGYIGETPINEVTKAALNTRSGIEILEQLRKDPPDTSTFQDLIDQATDTTDLLDFLSEMGIEDNELLRFIETLDPLTNNGFMYEGDFTFRKYRESMHIGLLGGRKLTPKDTLKLLGTSIDLGLIRAKKEDELVTFGFAVDFQHFRRLQELCRETNREN